jgi:MFS family permease
VRTSPIAPDSASDAPEAEVRPPGHTGSREIRALLVAAVLLRLGVVGGTDAVIFDLNDLAGGHPRGIAVGVVGAAQAVPEMLFAFVMARFADRFGRTRFLVGGPLLGAVGILLVAAANEPWQFACARILEGLGAAAFVPTALGTIAAATAGDRRARARASGAFEGATLAGFGAGFLLGSFSWHSLHRGAFFVMAAFYVGAALVVYRFVPRVPPLPVSPIPIVLKAIVGPGPIRRFIPAWLAVNCLVGAWYVNMTSLLKHAPDPHQTLVHGFDERLIGLFKLSWVLLLLIGIVIWTPHLQRHGGPITMRRAVPGAFLICAALFAINHLPLKYAPLLLPAVAVGVLIEAGFVPAAVAYLADCSESLVADRSALMAFYTVTLAGGGALGAFIGGVAGALLLFDGLILLGVVLTAIALVSLNSVVHFERAGGFAHHRNVGEPAPAEP